VLHGFGVGDPVDLFWTLRATYMGLHPLVEASMPHRYLCWM